MAPPIPPLPSCYNVDDQQSIGNLNLPLILNFKYVIVFFFFLEVVVTDDEQKVNKFEDDCSIQSVDGRRSKSEIKNARQLQRKR